MGSRIRCWRPDLPQSATRRTVDRQFLLRADREMRNTFGACLGRAQEKHPVEIYWFEQNVNHDHPGVKPIEGLEQEVSPLPHWRHLSEPQRQTRFRKLVREREQELHEERRNEGRRVFGVREPGRLEPRARPANPEPSGRQPVCHAASEERREFEREQREMRRWYAESSARYRAGELEVEFPSWTYKPPLVTMQTASGL